MKHEKKLLKELVKVRIIILINNMFYVKYNNIARNKNISGYMC